MSFTYCGLIYCIIKLQNCSSFDGRIIATKMSKCLLSFKVCNQTLNLLSLLHVPPSHKKIYIPLSLVHLIYMVGDKCIRENACFHHGLALWALLYVTEHRLHFSPPVKASRQFLGLSFIQFRFLALYRSGYWDLASVKGHRQRFSQKV